MPMAARIHRETFNASFPWIGALHTPSEDLAYWSEHLFKTSRIWGALSDGNLIGVISLSETWIEQLYVRPGFQHAGVGSALLDVAQHAAQSLHLWTFQRNDDARRFYEKLGFVLVKMTDGSENEEREPDVLYRWDKSGISR
ncbi:acetyltransferase [Rhizobium sp. Root483D2]|nr:acetyltransferase [Rhizobium sp. Root483D2]